MKIPTIEEMLKAGMHFGHRTSKWYPKMAPYIFGAKKGIHIIDLEKTSKNLELSLNFIKESVAQGKNILLVGTKSQAKEKIKEVGQETGMPYVSERWLGGLLTNFAVVKNSIRKYQDLVEKKKTGRLSKYTKKEQLNFDHVIAKLDLTVGGLVSLTKAPDMVFIWDIKNEEIALLESFKRKVPIIAVCDTNVNPEKVKYVIPANDDASKSVELVLDSIKEAILEGKKLIEKNK